MAISKDSWLKRIVEAAQYYKIKPTQLSKSKFEKFMYRYAANRATTYSTSWNDLLKEAEKGETIPEQQTIINKESQTTIDKINKEPVQKKIKVEKPNENYESMFHFDFSQDPEINPPEFKPQLIHKVENLKHGDVIISIPDLHFPFVSRNHFLQALTYVTRLVKSLPTDISIHIVQLGDILDLYGFSKYAKEYSLNLMKEIKIARESASNFWNAIPKQSNVFRYQLVGNHDTRTVKYVSDKAPELKDFIPTPKELLVFPDVFSCEKEKDMIQFKTISNDKVLAMHGYLSKSEAHLTKFKCSVIHGHLHSASVIYKTFEEGLMFAMNCGYLGDCNSYALAYAGTAHSKDWVESIGIVEVNEQHKFIPKIVPFFS